MYCYFHDGHHTDGLDGPFQGHDLVVSTEATRTSLLPTPQPPNPHLSLRHPPKRLLSLPRALRVGPIVDLENRAEISL